MLSSRLLSARYGYGSGTMPSWQTLDSRLYVPSARDYARRRYLISRLALMVIELLSLSPTVRVRLSTFVATTRSRGKETTNTVIYARQLQLKNFSLTLLSARIRSYLRKVSSRQYYLSVSVSPPLVPLAGPPAGNLNGENISGGR